MPSIFPVGSVLPQRPDPSQRTKLDDKLAEWTMISFQGHLCSMLLLHNSTHMTRGTQQLVLPARPSITSSDPAKINHQQKPETPRPFTAIGIPVPTGPGCILAGLHASNPPNLRKPPTIPFKKSGQIIDKSPIFSTSSLNIPSSQLSSVLLNPDCTFRITWGTSINSQCSGLTPHYRFWGWGPGLSRLNSSPVSDDGDACKDKLRWAVLYPVLCPQGLLPRQNSRVRRFLSHSSGTTRSQLSRLAALYCHIQTQNLSHLKSTRLSKLWAVPPTCRDFS